MKNKEEILKELNQQIEEGFSISKLEQPTKKDPKILTIRESDRILKWITFNRQFIITVFGEDSHFYKEFQKKTDKDIYYSSQVNAIRGILEGILKSIENDYLIKYSVRISASISDNILLEAKELLSNDHLLGAAIYVRIALETFLKKKAQSININTNQPISKVNDEFKSKNLHNKEMHSKIQSWLHLGNYAAHNTEEFKNYNKEKIRNYINEVNEYIKNSMEANNGN
jgi:hypothetical protein